MRQYRMQKLLLFGDLKEKDAPPPQKYCSNLRGDRERENNLFATLYHFIDTLLFIDVLYCMKYIV